MMDIHMWHGVEAGGSKNTFNVDDVGYASAAAAGLDGGTITPTGASVGTKQGFSIIEYTGSGANATVSHEALVCPKFGIIKMKTDAGYDWCVYHSSLTAAYALPCKQQQNRANEATTFNSTANK